MTRDRLADAADSLERAASAADGDARDRLSDQSEQFETLADADRGPDHGKLARHEHVLNEIADDAGGRSPTTSRTHSSRSTRSERRSRASDRHEARSTDWFRVRTHRLEVLDVLLVGGLDRTRRGFLGALAVVRVGTDLLEQRLGALELVV